MWLLGQTPAQDLYKSELLVVPVCYNLALLWLAEATYQQVL